MTLDTDELKDRTITKVEMTTYYGNPITGLDLHLDDGQVLAIRPDEVHYDQFSTSPCLSVKLWRA